MKSFTSLLQRQQQSLVITPQLIESIRLLQLAHTELHQFVEQEIEKNPFLDLASNDGGASGDVSSTVVDDPNIGARENHVDGPTRTDMPELPSQWKSIRDTANIRAGERPALDEFVASTETLHDHVARQIALTAFTPRERLIAGALADHLEDTGYLQVNLLELAGRLNIREADVERVLGALQLFDPPGIFARTLSECLEIQLRQLDRFDPAMAALVANLELLARRDFRALKRHCGVDEDDLLDMLHEIRTLDPKPGNRFQSGGPESIIPDVSVLPSPGGGWQIELNPDTLPKVLINQTYFAEVSRLTAQSSKDQSFLNECFQNASWLIRSLDQRATTILKVATEIVRHQDVFLEDGIAHLRPLNLKTIADAIDMHESTVSRVTSNKYMLTPRGVFELKYFFTVAIPSSQGGDAHSAEAVRHHIKAMIAAETLDDVHSDEAIVARLKETGIDIARRTVAKYREAMNIPSSMRRRREKRAGLY
ncbi:RNA polymerase factor sigma-54 [Rhizobium sp. SEMIA 4085]|uniref:RNA polymerase sigma-54 factor n=1 Tax=Rhizobium gallicum bv. gallicum R602sp TaxID=1041138 RepID=A0A0B4X6V6_9HYPH|nr:MULTISPECIES: RNA polymerase factor sigma-54 [Rhizobium]AJD43794.1 RNA polymerase sigma-54 factor RpoN 2 [Rhizobium gallicum bv. gallicum R602sp]NNH32234.1 RNA polymerase factor sigma-54 [Rhizobium sp. SEMIA 4085]TDW34275.1 RNA polymerase RpoN-/SigL-like sigma 54 subunit [Rhizobium azibense]